MASWTAIVLTCPNQSCVKLFQKELELRKSRQTIDKDVILLTVEDPQSNAGSGGATLNALLVVCEHISAEKGFAVLNADVLVDSLILIIHMGRSYAFDACSRGFASLPLERRISKFDCLVTNFDLLLETMTNKIAKKSPLGTWVCSSDMFFNTDSIIEGKDLMNIDACLITIPAKTDYCKNHGICKIGNDNSLLNIHYKCQDEEIINSCKYDQSLDLVPLVSGVVYLSTRFCVALLSLHTRTPLDSCTYLGLDSGTRSFQLSLFFDFLLAVCSEVEEESFVAGGSSNYSGRHKKMTTMILKKTEPKREESVNMLRKVNEEGNVEEISTNTRENQEFLTGKARNDEFLSEKTINDNLVAKEKENLLSNQTDDGNLGDGLHIGKNETDTILREKIVMSIEETENGDLDVMKEDKNKSLTNNNTLNFDFIRRARKLIWKYLRPYSIKTVNIGGEISYMDEVCSKNHQHLVDISPYIDDELWIFKKMTHSYIENKSKVDGSSVLINSYLSDHVHIASQSVVSHSRLGGAMQIGSHSLVNGLMLNDDQLSLKSAASIRDRICLTVYNINYLKESEGTNSCLDKNLESLLPNHDMENPFTCHYSTIVILGMDDDLNSSRTFCDVPFENFLRRTDIKATDLWPPNSDKSERTLRTAKLFPITQHLTNECLLHSLWLHAPQTILQGSSSSYLHKWKISKRLSLDQIIQHVDISKHLQQRRHLFFDICKTKVELTLVNNISLSLLPIYRTCVIESQAQLMLLALDKMGMENCNNAGLAARILANIADLLGEISEGQGGLRSGPASNKMWKKAYKLLEANDIEAGFKELAKQRNDWLIGGANHVVRAARHYEGAAQILIRIAVMSVREFIKTRNCEQPPMDKWVSIQCPARLDLSGGWSDTPPITYENGGAVLNVAITVNKIKPIGAKVKKIKSYEIIINLEDNLTIRGSELDFFGDFNQPQSPGSLIKAALICSGVVDYPSQVPLRKQLQDKLNSGLQIITWSILPHGSGLGTSSILAGAIIGCLWRVSGRAFDINSLIHAVLYLEQLLTTGGGWQDQVGGFLPGIKLGSSKPILPLSIQVDHLSEINENVLNGFEQRLLLVYTGQTRLAKNLLQNVVRNWYARDDTILMTQNNLKLTAHKCATAFKGGNLSEVGQCLDAYWQEKKTMAPGCEPYAVGTMIQLLKPLCHGICMAGAGGGGFMYLLTKLPDDKEDIVKALEGVQGNDKLEFYETGLDREGLYLEIENEGRIHVPFLFQTE